jgi:hypothetical protein
MADHDQWLSPETCPDQSGDDPDGLAPGQPWPAAIPGLVDPRPFEPDDRDVRHALDPPGIEPARYSEGPFIPGPATIMVAADEDERRVERVAEKCEPGQVEIAGTEDAVERRDGVASGRVVQSRFRPVRGREEADRAAGPALERPRIRPDDLDPADHRSSSVSGSAVARLTAARSSRLSSTNEANDSGGTACERPGATSSVTSASSDGCPP